MQLTLPWGGAVAAPNPEARIPFRPPADPTEAVRFIRSSRAKSYVLRVQPDGTLRVTVPRRGSRAEALRFIERQRGWIERERLNVVTRLEARRVGPGSSLLLRGVPVAVEVFGAGRAATVTYGGRRVAVHGSRDMTEAVERDLRQLARDELIPRLYELASEHDLTVTRVTIRNQRSRWGSCSHGGAIALNYRLVQMPHSVRDYVVLHELMHLKQQNHSRRFWRLVEGVFPEFREAERWLKSTGRALL